jgi:hypothetical protein
VRGPKGAQGLRGVPVVRWPTVNGLI